MPQFMRDQTSNSYDLYINVPNDSQDDDPPELEENIATLQITDGVLDSVLQLENGILELPSLTPALNTATNFNTNGKDYATKVSIDLRNLTYYSSMPEIDNGNYGNVIPVNENNVEITLLDDNNDKTDVEHTITPYNPNPSKRSIKAVDLTKDNTMRDVTAKDIVGYIRVNIPPPNISQTVQNNGYYNFNNDWTALTQGTEQDHKLNIQIPNSTETKTITENGTYTPTAPNIGFSSVNVNVPLERQWNGIDKTINITQNGTEVIQPIGDYYVLYPRLENSDYLGYQTRHLEWIGDNNFKVINRSYSTIGPFYPNTGKIEGWGSDNRCECIRFPEMVTPYRISFKGAVNSISFTAGYVDNSLGSVNSTFTVTERLLIGEIQGLSNLNGNVINCSLIRPINTIIIYFLSNGSKSYVSDIKIEGIMNENNYKLYKQVTVITNVPNGTETKTITENGTYTPTSPNIGFSQVVVNVPTTTINNYSYPTITTNGTYSIPSGYTGLNDLNVNVQFSSNADLMVYFLRTTSTEMGGVQMNITNLGIEVTPATSTGNLEMKTGFSFSGSYNNVLRPGESFYVDGGYKVVLFKIESGNVNYYTYSSNDHFPTTYYNDLSSTTIKYQIYTEQNVVYYDAFLGKITTTQETDNRKYFTYKLPQIPLMGTSESDHNVHFTKSKLFPYFIAIPK